MNYNYETRVGLGFDAHRFLAPAPGAVVTICGVAIPHDCGVEAHSDGDVGLHALVDALLGALALGDIGEHFPPTDPRWKDADSRTFVAHARKLVEDEGGIIVNTDIVIMAERPKVLPHREAMRTCVAGLLNIHRDRVSIKATTTERMGFTGRQEGLAAQAIVSVAKVVGPTLGNDI